MVISAVCDYPESSVFAQQELSNIEKNEIFEKG